MRFILGHSGNKSRGKVCANPSGLCMCGCGQPTSIATYTRTKDGIFKGQPIRYLPGHHRSAPVLERFWKYVDKRGPDECWEWQAFRDEHGYGHLSTESSKHMPAHRYSYEIHHGPIPDGLDICHKCDNPPCCNPVHLFAGTEKDNMADMVAKGRSRLRNRSHLTDEQIVEIRTLYATGKYTHLKLASMFNSNYASIGGIIRRELFKHVP